MRPLRRIQKGAGADYRTGLANPDDWLVDAMSAGQSWSGEKVTTEAAIQIPSVRSAISLISWALSICPLKVYKDERDGTQSPAEQHRAWPMLHDKPNADIHADLYWQLVTRQLLRYGNHFSLKGRDFETGLVNELTPLPPNLTTVKLVRGEKFYEVLDLSTNRRRTIPGSEVLHIMGDSDDGLIGVSPLWECREALGTALARMRFEASFYRRGAVLSGVIQHPGKLATDKAVQRLKRAFSARYEGASNAHGTAVLEEGATFNRTGAPMTELEFNESERRTRTDVALMFNLPSGFLAGDTGESLKYSTVEGNQIQFAQYAVAPWANRIAQAISADASIFPFSSWYAEFELGGLMRGDATSRATVYEKLFALQDSEGRRAIAVDEIRAKENWPPAEKEKPAEPPALPAPAEDQNGTVSDQPVSLKVAPLRG